MLNEIKEFINNSDYKLIGITGNAGSGKTTLSKLLSDEFTIYSADYKFIGDSNYRKELLEKKSEKSINSYIDACNQYNWWDWQSIYSDLNMLKEGKTVNLENKYNRDKGIYEDGIQLIPTDKIIYEGAILGHYSIIELLDVIFFIYTPKDKRLERLISKDLNRRSLNEILARFFITEYSEYIHYKMLFKLHKNQSKLIVLDSFYNIIANFKLEEDKQFIPLPILD